MKVLHVTFSDTLSLSPQVKYLSVKSAQTAFDHCTLNAHGLSGNSDSNWHHLMAHVLLFHVVFLL